MAAFDTEKLKKVNTKVNGTAEQINTKDYTNDKDIKIILKQLRNNFQFTQQYRLIHKKKYLTYENVFEKDYKLGSRTLGYDMFRAADTAIAVEQMKRLIKFPDVQLQVFTSALDNATEKEKTVSMRNDVRRAKALWDWTVKKSQVEAAFNVSKKDWCVAGDIYPVNIKKKRTKAATNVDGSKYSVAYPRVKMIDPRQLIFDANAHFLQSEDDEFEATFYGWTRIYSEEALISRYGGDWILEYAVPGAMVDYDMLSEVSGRNQNSEKFYEVIVSPNRARLSHVELVGSNAFPIEFHKVGRKIEVPLGLENNVSYSDKYPHYDINGEPCLDVDNLYIYKQSDSIRNFGLPDKLFRGQIANQELTNGKFAATRRAFDEMVVVSGGSKKKVDAAFEEYFAARDIDPSRAYIHVAGGLNGAIPQASVLSFKGTPAREGGQSELDIKNIQRNATGINQDRQYVQQNTGLGQSQLLDEERTASTEDIVSENIQNINRWLERVFYYPIRNKGFGISDEFIKYTKIELDKVSGNEIEIEGVTESIEHVCKDLSQKNVRFSVNQDTIIRRSSAALVEVYSALLSKIDPAAAPDFVKYIIVQIAKLTGGAEIPPQLLEGIENSHAVGGESQFRQQGGQPTQPAARGAAQPVIQPT